MQEAPQPIKVDIPPHLSGMALFSYWFERQPKDVQDHYKANGLAPETKEGDGNYVFGVKPDHRAFAYTEEQDSDIPQPAPRHYSEEEVQEIIRRIVMAMQMTESPDCLFQARCILIAFGIGDPPTETELAKQRDCSRQYVSKKVKAIQELFDLSPSQFMRSEAACRAYSSAWHKLHKTRKAKKLAPTKRKPRSTRTVTLTDPDNYDLPLFLFSGVLHQNKHYSPLTPPTPLPLGKKSIKKHPPVCGVVRTHASPKVV